MPADDQARGVEVEFLQPARGRREPVRALVRWAAGRFASTFDAPMTGHRLRMVLAASLLWLAAVGVLVVLIAALAPRAADTARALIPLAIAAPVVVYAYTFPLRLQFMRSFGELRTRLLQLAADVLALCHGGASGDARHIQPLLSAALDLKAAAAGSVPAVLDRELSRVVVDLNVMSAVVTGHIARPPNVKPGDEESHWRNGEHDRRKADAITAATGLQVLAARLTCP